jgi:DNA-binding response OmpR family regulator
MSVSLDREDRVKRQVQQPGRFGLPSSGRHFSQGTRRYGALFEAQPGRSPRAHRILFIEDDRFIADMYRLRLEGDGWSVDVVADGETGVRQAVADPPALILLDILLPRLDGIEVLRRIRSNEATRSVPVLVVSNAAGLSGRETEARTLGVVDWLVKANTTPAKLAERVNRILGN